MRKADRGEGLSRVVSFVRTNPGRRRLPAVLAAPLLLLAGCVVWSPLPPVQRIDRPLPRWVQVTTIDSTRFMLEHARVVAGDTVVGRSSTAEDSAPLIRIPSSRIAHLEARVPSGPGSIGVGALVIGGTFLLLASIFAGE